MSDRAAPISLAVLTGFLDSGKTALLDRLLQLPALAETAVLSNEFGEIGIDHHLVAASEDTTVLLRNSCVCCAVRDDLRAAILSLHERRARGQIPAHTRLMLATNGLADPVPVLRTLGSDLQLAAHHRVARTIKTVDAMHGAAQLVPQAEAHRQVAVADTPVVPKRDLVSLPALAALAGANPLAARTDARSLDPLVLIDPRWATRPALQSLTDTLMDAPSPHAQGCRTFSLHEAAAIDWPAFALWLTLLLHTHGSRTLRVRGLLEITGTPTPVVVNAMQRVMHTPRHLPA